jgi:Secretion system C-terminal sorting domain
MKSSFTNRFVFAALLCCGLFLINHNARAQCPDSTGPAPNPDIVAWAQDSSYYTIPGTACSIWIYYCERTILSSPSDTVQGWLDGIEIDSNTDCDSLADSTLVNDAQLALDTLVAMDNFDKLEPCFKNQYLIVQTYVPQCWNPVAGHHVFGQAYTSIIPCTAFGFYCERQCEACWNPAPPGEIQFQDCIVINPPIIMECTTGSPWLPGGCYALNCEHWTTSIEAAPLGVNIASTIDTSMQAYPNPVSGSLTVRSSISGEPIQILDVLGREVLHGIIPANGPLTLDVSSLSAGTYYVNGGHSEVKFIKN